MATSSKNRYALLIEHIFLKNYQKGDDVVPFKREEIVQAANELGVELPKNLGDVIYSFKYRTSLPESIKKKAPVGKTWIIVSKGRAKYAFEAKTAAKIHPDELLALTKIPDATPGIVTRYSLGDEQALLAKLRYNRLIDIFTSVTCYSLQNHLRTTVPGIGQVETDELYVGIDKKGAHYVFPVQAKGGRDEIGIVQIEQDIALCESKFPQLTCRAIAAQFMAGEVIALFEFEQGKEGVRKVAERHYKLVPLEELSEDELERYRHRPDTA